MDLDKAKALAIQLIDQYLPGKLWSFQFDRSKLRFGVCKHRSSVISLSKALVEINSEDQVRDTILHEIAHALVGPNNGHNKVWAQKALELGARPERCYNVNKVTTLNAPIKLECGHCGRVIGRFRRSTRNLACAPCCNTYNYGKYSKDYILRPKGKE